MTGYVLLNLILVLQISMLVFVIAGSIRLTGRGNKTLLPVFFSFAMVSFLLSDLYWIAYDVLRPDLRMPFAANEVGEWSSFLLMSAGLSEWLREEEKKIPSGEYPQVRPAGKGSALPGLLFAVFFAAANTILWIGWSGEWIQDIITGAVLGYYYCTLVRLDRRTDAFTIFQKILLTGACVCAVCLQALTFFVPDGTGKKLEICCSILCFGIIAFFFVQTLRARKRKSAGKKLCYAFCGFAWIAVTLYMSTGVLSLIVSISYTLILPFMLAAVKEEVEPA